MIVCKFGGSSVCDYTALCQVKKILFANSQRKIAVISAIGKRFPKDEKLTDVLIEITNAKSEFEVEKAFYKFYTRCKEFCEKFHIEPEEIIDFDALKYQIKSGIGSDYVISRGEYFTARVCAKFLNWEFCPAENIIIANNNKINFEKSKENFLKVFHGQNLVFPGFYVGNENGEITLLERGGSDTSGAILANLSNAEVYEKFSDVSGLFYSNSTNLLKNKVISSLSYGQLSTISVGKFQPFSSNAINYLVNKKVKCEIKSCKLNDASKTVLGEKGAFYFLKKEQSWQISNNVKNISKYRFICGIFKTFMFDKIHIKQIKYKYNRLFVETNKSLKKCKPIECTNLFLFGKKYQNLKKQICRYLKTEGFIYFVNNFSIQTQKSVIKIFGTLSEKNYTELIKILDKK